MNWRRDDRGEYTLDLMGNRLPLMTVDEYIAVEAGCKAAAEHNRRAREAFKSKLEGRRPKR